MCSICNKLDCPTTCPNHNIKEIYRCGCCGDGICDGEGYYKIGKSYFHMECLLDNYSNDELLSLLGAGPRIATRVRLACVFVGVKNEKQD